MIALHARPRAIRSAAARRGTFFRFSLRYSSASLTFRPDRLNGIGSWNTADLANALIGGVSPQRTHYYPVFPYTSFTGMRLEDIKDLMAYLRTLPPVPGRPPPHDLYWCSEFAALSGSGNCYFSAKELRCRLRRTIARAHILSRLSDIAPNAILHATSSARSNREHGSPAESIRKAPALFPTSPQRRG